MHNTFHFLKHLSAGLSGILPGMALDEFFSQERNEFVMTFGKEDRHFIIKVSLHPDFTALSFPKEFHRAKRGSTNIFPELSGKTVRSVRQVKNDRAFLLEFEGSCSLLFKLHGSRSNLVLFRGNDAERLARPKLKNDLTLKADELDREADLSFEKFEREGLKKTFFTLGSEAEKILLNRGFAEKDLREQYDLILQLLKETENGQFYITRLDGRVVLSLTGAGEVLSVHSSAIEASNAIHEAHFRYNFLEYLKNSLIREMEKLKKQSGQYIHRCETRIKEIEKEEAPEKIADVIMANLHAIPPGAEKVRLFNFYTENEIEIRLKKNLSPQKYAELLYKKGKNRPLEISKLRELINEKTESIRQIEKDLSFINHASDYKELQAILKKYRGGEKQKAEPEDRFKTFEFMGWKIFVGKNAGNNDELTMHFAHKNDLWLHARDVTGSHVVIRHKSGQNFPLPVIEKAASVAAYHSQRKNDSLCPVIYTPKKFVRKIKGAPKGSVKVEKEKVIMIPPADI